MPTNDSSSTLPRVDSHLPGPGERWVPRAKDLTLTVDPDVPPRGVTITGRDHWDVHYEITAFDGVTIVKCKTQLAMFLEHYRREADVDTHVVDDPDARAP